jgi:hypothetical protein
LTTPTPPDPAAVPGSAAYAAADQADRQFAAQLATAGGNFYQQTANVAYAWLRNRVTLRPASIVLIPGTPTSESESPVTASIDILDSNVLPFTLGGLDAKGEPAPAPADTWAWTLTDPDNSGAVLTVSTDTLSATVAAGTPTPNLSLSVVGQTTGFTGAEAIIVTSGPATQVALVPGTPATET